MKIAFIQLASWGDCVNSTLMFKPIADAFPGCTLDVFTTDLYKSAFDNNPYISTIKSYPASSKSDAFSLYNVVPKAVSNMGYNKVFSPAPILHPTKRNSLKHPEFGENIITTFMRALEEDNIPYEWPVKTILRLTDSERHNVARWISANKIKLTGSRNILMEVHGESGQTFWTPQWTTTVVHHLMQSRGDTNVFISNKSRTTEIAHLERESRGRVKWCGDLTIRECSDLFNYCDIFFSVSSGLSNACNTDQCKVNIGWFETVNSPTVTSAPVREKGKVFWYENDVSKFRGMLADRGV